MSYVACRLQVGNFCTRQLLIIIIMVIIMTNIAVIGDTTQENDNINIVSKLP